MNKNNIVIRKLKSKTLLLGQKTFVNKNPISALKLGHARGAIISAAGGKGVPIIDYTANQIKKAVVGRGHATKEQVSFMVQQLLKLNKAPQADAGDALAGAICHGYHAL